MNESNLPTEQQTAPAPVETKGGDIVSADREVKAVQYAMAYALQHPRSIPLARSNIEASCTNKRFADKALFAYRRGTTLVTGPTIRMAEEMARAWGHIEHGTRIISRTADETEMEAFAWDMQNNVRSRIAFKVKHVRDTKKGKQFLTDERDIYEATASSGSRRLRACILRVLPTHLVDEAVEIVKQTLDGDTNIKSVEDRSYEMLNTYKKIGVSSANIENYLGHSIDNINLDQLRELGLIYNSITGSHTKISDWFGKEAGTDNEDAKRQIQELKTTAKPTQQPPETGGDLEF